MPIIQDEEFGKVVVRRSALGSQVRLRVGPDGTLRASLPPYAPLFLVKRLLASSRPEIRKILNDAAPKHDITSGMRVGKSHQIIINELRASETSIARKGLRIEIDLGVEDELDSPDVIRQVRDVMAQALRIEAKSYLPHRLSHLAEMHGFTYSNIRFSHSGGRWGSCNSKGTISLNIALMNLPFEVIDYVLIHELAHTKQMNHSPEFWSIVAACDPNYKSHKRILKSHNPTI